MDPTVAVCQIAIDDLAVSDNLARVRDTVHQLHEDVELAVFPEASLTGFLADERLHSAALDRNGSTVDELRALATQAETALVVGFIEAAEGDLYNATAYIDADGQMTVYRKRHLWGDEQTVLTPGEARVTVETPLGSAGLLTCYDLNFVGESAAFAAPSIRALLVVGAWPGAYSENWRLLVRARALDGVRWVVGANRTGTGDAAADEAVTYAGRSLVARPDGGIHQALDRQPRTLVTTLDPEVLASQRELIDVFPA
jgi:(R)-amidase